MSDEALLPPPPPPPPATSADAATAAATLEFTTPDSIARWRPFVQWLLAVPHLIIAGALGYVARAVAIVSWFIILFTGKLPAGLANLQCMYLRYNVRALSYVGFLRTSYPPFGFDMSPADPGDDPPVRLDLRPQLERRNRLSVAFRLILAIPHLIALMVLGLAAFIVGFIAAFAVLFTGAWPAGMRSFVIGVARWEVRVESYLLLLHDEYPPFSLH